MSNRYPPGGFDYDNHKELVASLAALRAKNAELEKEIQERKEKYAELGKMYHESIKAREKDGNAIIQLKANHEFEKNALETRVRELEEIPIHLKRYLEAMLTSIGDPSKVWTIKKIQEFLQIELNHTTPPPAADVPVESKQSPASSVIGTVAREEKE